MKMIEWEKDNETIFIFDENLFKKEFRFIINSDNYCNIFISKENKDSIKLYASVNGSRLVSGCDKPETTLKWLVFPNVVSKSKIKIKWSESIENHVLKVAFEIGKKTFNFISEMKMKDFIYTGTKKYDT